MARDLTPRVFVSSTSDLAEERRALNNRLSPEYRFYLYETEPAMGVSPHDRLVEVLDKTHVFLGILGPDRGSDLPNDAEDRSIVEWEFDTAKSVTGVYLIVLVRENARADTQDSRQAAFIDRVEDFFDGLWTKHFTSIDDLVKAARSGLAEWGLRYWKAIGESNRRIAAYCRRWLQRVSFLFVALSLGGVVISTSVAITKAALIVFLSIALSAMTACFVLSEGIRGSEGE